MTPEHVKRIEKLEKAIAERPIVNHSQFAMKDHHHRREDWPGHSHPEMKIDFNALAEFKTGLEKRMHRVENRPILDPNAYAKKGHSHPPTPLQAHTHPEIAEVRAVAESVESEVESKLSDILRRLEACEVENKKLRSELNFTRDLLDRTIAAKERFQDHGHQGGGRLHSQVNDRLAGFATPEMFRKIETLWDKHTSD